MQQVVNCRTRRHDMGHVALIHVTNSDNTESPFCGATEIVPSKSAMPCEMRRFSS